MDAADIHVLSVDLASRLIGEISAGRLVRIDLDVVRAAIAGLDVGVARSGLRARAEQLAGMEHQVLRTINETVG